MRTPNSDPGLRRVASRGLAALVLFCLGLTWQPARADTASHALLARAASAHWIAEGHGKRVVYVIFDPNCPYCHVVYQESQAHLNKYQFRWIPVDVLTRSSPGKAAALLAAHKPVAALRLNENRFVRKRGKLGGIKPLHSIPPSVATELKDNVAVLRASGTEVVPKLLYLRRDGKVRLIVGAVDGKDLSATLRDVARPGKS
ncbi:MAG TPA: thioredoxin fold domain-containing protein [Gammaproteobacteria bacterium]|nr:thioredoxin fold domain-containing protein [Gammaproteobacteria bacterium]